MSDASTLPVRSSNRTLGTAVERWAGVGPYYAMFPVEFASTVVNVFTSPGDSVLDPFAGRGTSVFAAASNGRRALGIEINPVGWLYGAVKLNPSSQSRVLARLSELLAAATDHERWDEQVRQLPPFFTACYQKSVRRFLVAARQLLRWNASRVDRTLMAFLLIYLHGKRGAALSNQMRDGKSVAPNYAVRWWKTHRMRPPLINLEEFLTNRIEWRFRKGRPDFADSRVRLGDCIIKLQDVERALTRGSVKPFKLLFTSPPYFGVTNYHYDQWLRRWLLGGPPRPVAADGPWRKRFESPTAYEELLDTAFERAGSLLRRDSVIYVRTDAREFTLETTKAALARNFPRRTMRLIKRPFQRQTQTALFGDKSYKPGEVDIIVS